MNQLMGIELMWRANEYVSLLLWMVLGVGMSFEFPLILSILIYVGILSQQQLKSFRRYSIVLMFIISAFITPTPDPFTQSLVAGPLILLYEASILMGGVIERRKKKEYEAEFGSWDEEDDGYHD